MPDRASSKPILSFCPCAWANRSGSAAAAPAARTVRRAKTLREPDASVLDMCVPLCECPITIAPWPANPNPAKVGGPRLPTGPRPTGEQLFVEDLGRLLHDGFRYGEADGLGCRGVDVSFERLGFDRHDRARVLAEQHRRRDFLSPIEAALILALRDRGDGALLDGQDIERKPRDLGVARDLDQRRIGRGNGVVLAGYDGID